VPRVVLLNLERHEVSNHVTLILGHMCDSHILHTLDCSITPLSLSTKKPLDCDYAGAVEANSAKSARYGQMSELVVAQALLGQTAKLIGWLCGLVRFPVIFFYLSHHFQVYIDSYVLSVSVYSCYASCSTAMSEIDTT
jgi:hypothetical protein